MKTLAVVDSSGWLEYFTGSSRAQFFAPAIEDTENLVVPIITIYEVFKKVHRERGESAALQVASSMQGGTVVDLDLSIALDAARLQLPLADSIIYTTAQRHGAVLWTQDDHFNGLPSVRYFPIPSTSP
jgi:predicted nucleic acid-binding protein